MTPWTAAHQASLSFTISLSFLGGYLPYPPCPSLSSLSHYLSEFAQTHVHWISDAIQHLILCHPFLLLPSILPSIRVFSNESALCISWPKYWRFSISSSNEYSGLISFRIEWFDLLAVQGMLKSLFPATQFEGINSIQWYLTKWTYFLSWKTFFNQLQKYQIYMDISLFTDYIWWLLFLVMLQCPNP